MLWHVRRHVVHVWDIWRGVRLLRGRGRDTGRCMHLHTEKSGKKRDRHFETSRRKQGEEKEREKQTEISRRHLWGRGSRHVPAICVHVLLRKHMERHVLLLLL